MSKPDGKPYKCTKEGCTGRQHFRGKIYDEHWEYRESAGPRAESIVMDEIHEPSVEKAIKFENGSEIVGIGMDGSIHGARRYLEGELMIETVDRVLDGLKVKEVKRLLEKKKVVRRDGYKAIWRLGVWSCKDSKDIPFSVHETRKYAIFIALDKGEKFRGRDKKKWRKYLKDGCN